MPAGKSEGIRLPPRRWDRRVHPRGTFGPKLWGDIKSKQMKILFLPFIQLAL